MGYLSRIPFQIWFGFFIYLAAYQILMGYFLP